MAKEKFFHHILRFFWHSMFITPFRMMLFPLASQLKHIHTHTHHSHHQNHQNHLYFYHLQLQHTSQIKSLIAFGWFFFFNSILPSRNGKKCLAFKFKTQLLVFSFIVRHNEMYIWFTQSQYHVMVIVAIVTSKGVRTKNFIKLMCAPTIFMRFKLKIHHEM